MKYIKSDINIPHYARSIQLYHTRNHWAKISIKRVPNQIRLLQKKDCEKEI